MEVRPLTAQWKPHKNPIYAPEPFAGVPELHFLGFSKFHSAQKLPMHTHEGMMEITYLATGVLTWYVEHEQRCDLHGGHVHCTWPGERHGGVDGVWQPCEMYWMLVTLPRVMPDGYLGLPAAEAQALHRSLWGIPHRTFSAAAPLTGQFRQLCDLLNTEGPLSQLSVRSALLEILLETCRCAHHPDAAGVLSAPIAKAAEIMRQCIEKPRTLPVIARDVGLSTSHFSRRFKQETGSAPGDYYVHCRISAARRFITETDLSLTEIARRCGFGTSQYLATCFRRVTGRTPSSFRKG
jgi:AraC-like DNA-binding protein